MTGTYGQYRRQTIERLGHQVTAVDWGDYTIANSLLSKVAYRLAAGPHALRLNADLLQIAERERPEIFWSDKGLLVQPATLKRMRQLGVFSVSYMIDNAFGPRRDPGWRLYNKDIPFYDLHVTQRDVSIPDYLSRGAPNVMKVQTAFEPTVHYPPPARFSDADRDRFVSFVGSPYDDRAAILQRLHDDGVPVIVNGAKWMWNRQFRPDVQKIVESNELWDKDYRDAIWRSRINLSFLTKANRDENTHKSFEIAACEGFLLAERSEGHRLKFKEDEEAVFFSDYDELKAKILRYLPDEAARTSIAAAGHARAMRDGYGNDTQVGRGARPGARVDGGVGAGRPMIRDLEQGEPEPGAIADVCIVGAGAAGIVLALELLRQGKTVTLLEGGGPDVEERSQEPYRSEIAGMPHNGIHTGRFRAHGGTTNRWGGQILELDELDFAERDWVPGSGWPFAKETLAPYYERALALEGLGNVLRKDADVWGALRLGMPRFEGLEPYCSRWCPEPQFAILHRQTLTTHPALTVWLHANAVELMLDGDKAAGVRCRTLGGREAAFRAAEYVFCLGAIESSRFFLQPREGALPWNESGLLGRHFQDHVDTNGAEVIPKARVRFHEAFDNIFYGGFKYHPKVRLAAGLQQQMQTLNVAGTMYFISDVDEQLMALKGTAKNVLRGRLGEVKPAELAGMAANLPLLARQAWRFGVQHRAYNPVAGKIMLRLHCEQEPLGRSSIRLADERDSLGMLRTRLDWQVSGTEVDTMQRYVEVARTSLAGLAEIVPDAGMMAGEMPRLDDSNHHMSGMRMAVSERDGVVAPDLRLHGTRNVFICSSAVFPTSGFSNPTHTLLALAVRLADRLAAPDGAG